MTPEPDKHLGFHIHDVARLMRHNFNRRVQSLGLGLTLAQCRVIVHLARQEGMQQVKLAELLDIQPITLARLLDKLEASGLIERRRDPADRRAFCIYLSPQGRPVLERIREQGTRVRADACAGLDEAQMKKFLQVLQRIENNLLTAAEQLPAEVTEHE